MMFDNGQKRIIAKHHDATVKQTLDLQDMKCHHFTISFFKKFVSYFVTFHLSVLEQWPNKAFVKSW